MVSVRAAGFSVLAVVVGISLASAASGETTSASESAASQSPSHDGAAARKKPAHTKKKKQKRTTTTLSPRTASHLTLAASADGPWSGGMGATPRELYIDESLLPPPTHGGCPPEMASIDRRFCIDKWEASLVEVGDNGGEQPFSPFLVVDGHEVRARSAPSVYPQGYISGNQAQAACEKAGKRLCSPNEWRKACVGPASQLYGYGTMHHHGTCNDEGRSPMLQLFSGSLGQSSDWDPLKMNDPRLNQLPGALARTGSHRGCTNGYGVYDMVGNLHEWTSDPQGTFQGGYYLDTSINGEGCSYRTTAHDFDYHDYSTGFRCCADPR